MSGQTLQKPNVKWSPGHEQLGAKIGALVDSKNAQYGEAWKRAADFIRLLWGDTISVDQYRDVLLLVRMFDKMCRISQGHMDDSYEDIAGYALLGANNGRSDPKRRDGNQ